MNTKIAIVLCFMSLFSKAQEIPKLNAGIDFLTFKGSYENENGTTHYSSRGGIFLEKAFQLYFINQFVLSPGLSFKSINEKYSGGGMGGGSSSDLNHHTISGYLKIIHRAEIIKFKPSVLYYGGFGGAHFYTWAKGSASNHSTLYEQANWENPNYKEDPSHLFKKMYIGFLAGVEFATTGFIRPSFEVRFMPIYAESHGNLLNPFELAINLAFGSRD